MLTLCMRHITNLLQSATWSIPNSPSIVGKKHPTASQVAGRVHGPPIHRPATFYRAARDGLFPRCQPQGPEPFPPSFSFFSCFYLRYRSLHTSVPLSNQTLQLKMNLCVKCRSIGSVPVEPGKDTLIYTKSPSELMQAHHEGCFFCTEVYQTAVYHRELDDLESGVDCYVCPVYEGFTELDFHRHCQLLFRYHEHLEEEATGSRFSRQRRCKAFHLEKKDEDFGAFKG